MSLCLERGVATEELESQHPQGPDVHCHVMVLAFDHFWWQVVKSAAQGGSSGGGGVHGPSKVSYFDFPMVACGRYW